MFVSFRVTGTQNLQEMISSTCHGVFWPAEDEGPTSWATQRIRQRPQRCTSTWHIFCHLTWTLCSLNCWSLDMFQLGTIQGGGFIWFFLGREVWQGFRHFQVPFWRMIFKIIKCDLYLLRYVSSHQFSVHISGSSKGALERGVGLFCLKLAKGTPFSVGEITGVNKNYSRNH